MLGGLFGRSPLGQQANFGIKGGMGMQQQGGMGMKPMMAGDGLFNMSRPAMMPRKPNHLQQLFNNPQFGLGMGLLNSAQGGNPMEAIINAMLMDRLNGGGLFS